MNDTQALKVDCRILLSLYLLAPLIFLAIIADQLFTSGTFLQDSLPNSPGEWAFWVVIFNLPHIVASWVTFADREYIQNYRRNFTLVLPLICLATYILHFAIGGPVAFMVYASYTLYHVLSQQLGITAMMIAHRPSLTFKLWKWLLVLCIFPLFLVVVDFYPFSIDAILGITVSQWGIIISGLFLLASLPGAFLLSAQSKHRIGTVYLWANVAMIVTILFCVISGYYALAIVVPRIIHDITAFIVYMTHDRNRNLGESKNYFYKMFAFTKISPVVLCPLIAIILAYPITNNSYLPQIYFVVLVLGYFHYYIEALIWKKGSPHRQNLDFKIV